MRAFIPVVVAAVFFSAAPAFAASFDCAKANSKIEKAICADPAASELDGKIADAYAALRKSLAAPDAAALKADQRAFVAARNQGFAIDADSLRGYLKDRLAFLQSLVAAPAGFPGHWQNEFGFADIAALPDGSFSVTVDTGDPVSARWGCRFEGRGRLVDGKLDVVENQDSARRDWTLDLTRIGGRLNVYAVPGVEASEGDTFPHCGENGSVNGDYFAAKK